MWRRSTLLEGSQTPAEAAQDPYSPTFGQFRYDINAIEPGLDLKSPLGRFRNDRNFKQARINLMKAFDNAEKIKGSLDLTGRSGDRNFRAIAMIGSAMMGFFTAAKSVEDALWDRMSIERELAGVDALTPEEWAELQKEFYKAEGEVMRDWMVKHTGEDPASIQDMLAGLYAAAGTSRSVSIGSEFGVEMARRSRENQERREVQRMEDERTAREQARERSRFWREWRMKQLEIERREQEGEAGQVPAGARTEIPEGSAAGDILGGLGMGEPERVPVSAGPAQPPPAPQQQQRSPNRITSFRNEHFFLSNMSDSPITILGVTYPRVENAFQSLKTAIPEEKAKFVTATGAAAKSLGKRVTLEGGPEWWNEQRVPVMLELLRIKFSNPALAQMLLATGTAELVEGNTWGDKFWGVSGGRGENMLGKLLMQVRDELRTRSNGRRRF